MKATFKYEYQIDANDLDEEQRTFELEGNEYLYKEGNWYYRKFELVKQQSVIKELNKLLEFYLKDCINADLNIVQIYHVLEEGILTIE
jgi:hypothetical protein